jgi:hypothetical protein
MTLESDKDEMKSSLTPLVGIAKEFILCAIKDANACLDDNLNLVFVAMMVSVHKKAV